MNYEQRLTSMLIPFYLGEQTDSHRRRIQEIWAWDFEVLEHTHNYIQWLFPIAEKSAFNSDAPLVDEKVIQAFKEDSRLQKNLRQSLAVMLQFYGLQSHEDDGKVVINRAENYSGRKYEWVNMFNHNYLRITRILKCLMLFGLDDEAQAFYDCLRQIYREDSEQIGSKTFRYWTNAVETSSVR